MTMYVYVMSWLAIEDGIYEVMCQGQGVEAIVLLYASEEQIQQLKRGWNYVRCTPDNNLRWQLTRFEQRHPSCDAVRAQIKQS